MAESSAGFHEPLEKISEETLEFRRGILSLMEELEAIDWYQQRIDASEDEELKKILAHNRDEEKEHAAMSLEWLRKKDPALDEQLRKHLFREGSVTGSENHDHNEDRTEHSRGSLNIGSLKGEKIK